MSISRAINNLNSKLLTSVEATATPSDLFEIVIKKDILGKYKQLALVDTDRCDITVTDLVTGLVKDIITGYTRTRATSNILMDCQRKYGAALRVGDLISSAFTKEDVNDVKEAIEVAVIRPMVYDAISEVAQLALTGIIQGDYCRRNDEGVTYVALNSDNINMADWAGISEPGIDLYDAVIDISGDADYTKLSTALADIGAGTYFYISGEIETLPVIIPEDVTITWRPDSEIEINGGWLQPHANGNSTMLGKVTITGTGDNGVRGLINYPETANDCDWGSNCKIILKPIGAGLTNGSSGAIILARLQGERNSFNVTLFDGTTYNTSDETWIFYLRGVNKNTEYKLNITDLNTDGDGDIYGVIDYVQNGRVDLLIDGISKTGAGVARGVWYKNTAVNTTYAGLVIDCDDGNTFEALGTGNNVTGLIAP